MSLQRSLGSIYRYFGAHNVPGRAEHEKSRSIQRVLFTFVMGPLGLFIAREVGLTATPYNSPIIVLPMLYGCIAAGYYFFLQRFPQGGVGAQYLFLIIDPVLTVSVITAEPKGFGWYTVMLLVFVTRTGIRYGMRSMVLSWLMAVAASLIFLGATLNASTWEENKDVYLILFAALFLGPPLFIPVIRLQMRSREFELQKIKVTTLEETLVARNAFLSRVSHELKSPLQSILTTMDLLEMQAGQPVDTQILERMRRAAGGLSAHLSDLLTLARGEAGGLTLKPEPVELSRLIDELADSAREMAKAKGLKVYVEAPDDLGVVVVDRLRLAQVVENLLTNAVKYTARGHVTLRVQPLDTESGLIRIAVADSGQGIETENLKTIFTTYERVGARTQDKEGYGVGLAVVQTLLDYLGGRASVESTVGIGSIFSVEVPALLPSDRTRKEGRWALIIDGDIEALRTLRTMVAEQGFSVDIASSVGLASNLLASRRYDVVLFDLQLPVKSGAALASDIRRSMGPNQHSRFVAVAGDDEAESGARWPFNSSTKKPVSPRALKRLLSERTPIPEPR